MRASNQIRCCVLVFYSLVLILSGQNLLLQARAQSPADLEEKDKSNPLQGKVNLWTEDKLPTGNQEVAHPDKFSASVDVSTIRASGQALKDQCLAWMNRNHPELSSEIEKALADGSVVELASLPDHTGPMLKLFGIQCQEIKAKELDEDLLAKTKVLIIDCNWLFRLHRLKNQYGLIRDFVSKGGTLITTGWGSCLVEEIFPDYFTIRKKLVRVKVNSPYCFIDIEPACSDARLFKGCPPGSNVGTCLGTRSIIPVSKETKPLLHSAFLENKTHNVCQYAACAFPFGQGSVLDFVCHLDGLPYAYNLSGHAGLIRVLAANYLGPREIGLAQLLTVNYICQALSGSSALAHNDNENAQAASSLCH